MNSFGRVFVLLLALSAPVSAQQLTVKPTVFVPVADSWRWFQSGLGAGVSWGFPIETLPLSVAASVDALTLFDRAQRPILLALVSPGASYAFTTGGAWLVTVNADLGLAVASKGDFGLAAANAFGSVGVGGRMELAPTLSFETGLKYLLVNGLAQGITLWASFTLKDSP